MARDFFDGRGIGLQVFHPLVELAILFVELIDFLSNLRRFFLRASHGHDAMRSKNILQREQHETNQKNRPRIRLDEFLQPRDVASGLIHVRASSARCCAAFSEVDSV